VIQGDVDALEAQEADIVLLLAVLHHHADVEPLLRAALRCRPELVLEWHVREQPFHHSTDRVMSTLHSLGYRVHIAEAGERPILLARPSVERAVA
jgi:hypothetical protein